MINFIKPNDLDRNSFIGQLVSQSPTFYIGNFNTQLRIMDIDDHPIVVSVGSEYHACYECSMCAQFVMYPLDELTHINSRYINALVRLLVYTMKSLSKLLKLNDVVIVNNLPFSSVIYPRVITSELDDLVDFMVASFPDKAIVLRGVNSFDNVDLLKKLNGKSFHLIPTMPVNVIDTSVSSYRSSRDVQRDFLLLKNTSYSIVTNNDINFNDYSRIAELYKNVFIQKHSDLNADLKASFFKLAHESGFIELMGLRNAAGELDAFVAFYDHEGVTVAPYLGYDTGLPKELGLYRMLSAYSMIRAEEKKLIFNFGPGSSKFKLNRGATQHSTYTAVHLAHLSFFRRIIWLAIKFLYDVIGMRIINKYKL